MMLQVQCPNDGDKCLVSDCDIKEELVFLGDDQQNIQCTNCGFASNQKYKGETEEEIRKRFGLDDPEDMAQGGRAGFKDGLTPSFEDNLKERGMI